MERGTHIEIEGYRPQEEDLPPPRHIGTWPDREALGRSLADDFGLTKYLEQVPAVIRPYVRLDYRAVVEDMCRNGGLSIVDVEHGIKVFERRHL